MRIGIFQCAGGGLSTRARLDKLTAAIGQESFDLVVCPELFLSGYTVGESIIELAESQSGEFAQQVAALAMTCGSAILYGYPERHGNQLFNSALCINKQGRVIANHRKLLLPPGFESDYFESGKGLTLFELNGICCAILICYDAEFPEAVRAATKAGALLVCVPTALTEQWRSVAFNMMPTRAFENGVWLAYANHAGSENGVNYLGASCIVAPDGKDYARAGHEETLISARFDAEHVAAARARLPYHENIKRLQKLMA